MSMSSRPPLITPHVAAASPIELRTRGDFVEWLAGTGGSLAVTTYNSGKLALLSVPAGELIASYWSFPRPMGLAFAGRRLALATRDHFWQFEIEAAESAPTTDPTVVTPQLIHATGRLDAHDVAFDRRGFLFANTRFNGVARPSDRVHFVRVWRPAFMDSAPPTRAVDCCHLNGIGVREGRLAMATAFCEQSEPAAWRASNRFQSGVLIDVLHDRVVARGLSLPHSPRWHADQWWVCDSGRGSLAAFHPSRELCDPVIELPGFTRGLTFVGSRAVVGLSRIRKRHILDAPPVRERWQRLRSGLSLVDHARGVETGSLEFIRGGREVYDVAFIAGVTAATFADPTAR